MKSNQERNLKKNGTSKQGNAPKTVFLDEPTMSRTSSTETKRILQCLANY